MASDATPIGIERLHAWMEAPEDERLEFKEAKNRFDFEKLVRYCAALANEGGGKIILGVTDKRPREIVGSNAFPDLERTRESLFRRIRLRVRTEEVRHGNRRVVIFHTPSREAGTAVQVDGAYWMRAGDSLEPMPAERLRKIFDETEPDASAEICREASIADLEPTAIEEFRRRWRRKSGNAHLDQLSPEQLLTDAELLVDGQVTYAALILLGTRPALGRYLAQAEIIFEYRSSEASLTSQQRAEFREGFLSYYDRLWEVVNLRNDVQPFLDGLFMREIPTFNEEVVREAVLNAVCHRDYRDAGSVFVRQFPRNLEVESPGGFLPGITAENVLWRQKPRNRRLAENFARCGLVERSGQGMNRMFEESIKDGKSEPDFSRTDEYQVVVTLRGEVQDSEFLRILERIGQETLASFTTADFIIVERLYRDQPIPDNLLDRLPLLREKGIVERIGRGKGARDILSRRFYGALGKKGVYTRKKGLDRQTNKALLLRHISDNRRDGSRLQELVQVLPALSRDQIQKLLQELKGENRITLVGRTSGARWFPAINRSAEEQS